jgi:hypothetical protein
MGPLMPVLGAYSTKRKSQHGRVVHQGGHSVYRQLINQRQNHGFNLAIDFYEVLTHLHSVSPSRTGHGQTMSSALPQGRQQAGQAIVVNLVHQRQQAPNLAGWKAFAGEPVQVITRQIGDETPFMLAKGHLVRDQQFQVFCLHVKRMSCFFRFTSFR